MFPVTSRYHGIETAKYKASDGRETAYLRRRFVLPVSPDAPIIVEHTVTQAERLDTITARCFGDAEQFWRVSDANDAMRSEELTAQIGRRLRIFFPQGGAIQPCLASEYACNCSSARPSHCRRRIP
jgi:hypothetical protein